MIMFMLKIFFSLLNDDDVDTDDKESDWLMSFISDCHESLHLLGLKEASGFWES